MVPLNVVFLLGACLGASLAGKHDIYSRHSVHRVSVTTENENTLIHQLETSLELDVWEHGAPPDRDYIIRVTPEQEQAFLNILDDHGIAHALRHPDVARMFEEFDEQIAEWRKSQLLRNSRIVPFENYPSYAEVNDYLEYIAAQYPDLATLVTAGPSYEGRDVKYLKISTTNFTDTSKPIYFLDATIHAREWVTTPVALYTIHRLVEDLRTEDRDLLEDIDWIILPIVNPDGFEYSRDYERLWRRTRSYNESVSVTCYGVDANRNFDVAFNTIGVSANPCAQDYPGTEPFSEPETRYVRDIMFEYLERIQMYLNIHSHGNWLLYGFGDTTLPANSLQIFHVGAAMGAAIDALKLPQARYYRVGNSAILLYPTSGSAQDYGQRIGIPFSYTLELPGYTYAFQVPPSYIQQINTETWAGLAASARLARLYYRARS
ncbi:carboxypeptidase B-like [Amyelois transitella]|uniref:carboxypeptidase B-like n=1 Tax=Amyelois transitella TaxID=680683 RepID=UPI00067AB5BF|nr:carboxypeptidase B-like [Amyelois transitella]